MTCFMSGENALSVFRSIAAYLHKSESSGRGSSHMMSSHTYSPPSQKHLSATAEPSIGIIRYIPSVTSSAARSIATAGIPYVRFIIRCRSAARRSFGRGSGRRRPGPERTGSRPRSEGSCGSFHLLHRVAAPLVRAPSGPRRPARHPIRGPGRVTAGRDRRSCPPAGPRPGCCPTGARALPGTLALRRRSGRRFA